MTDTSMPGGNGIPLQELPSWSYSLDPVAGTPVATFPGVVNITGENTGPLAGLRNRIINGNFQINQRGYVSGTAIAASTWGHDRWRGSSITGGATYTFVQGSPDTLITITAGNLQQVIEGANIEGGTYVLSWQGTALGRNNASGGFVASPVILTGITAGANLTVEFQNGTLGKVQLEAGTIPTPFERRPIGLELSLCYRYYQRYIASGLSFQGYGAAGQGVAWNFPVVPMQGNTTPVMNILGTWTFTNCTAVNKGAFNNNGLSTIVQILIAPTALGSFSANVPIGGGFDVLAEF